MGSRSDIDAIHGSVAFLVDDDDDGPERMHCAESVSPSPALGSFEEGAFIAVCIERALVYRSANGTECKVRWGQCWLLLQNHLRVQIVLEAIDKRHNQAVDGQTDEETLAATWTVMGCASLALMLLMTAVRVFDLCDRIGDWRFGQAPTMCLTQKE